MTEKNQPPLRRRSEQVGVVVRAKMQKTVVVAVERLVRHPVYRKTIKRTSTFMAHDEKGAARGDRVRIVETRPLSAWKRSWARRSCPKRTRPGQPRSEVGGETS